MVYGFGLWALRYLAGRCIGVYGAHGLHRDTALIRSYKPNKAYHIMRANGVGLMVLRMLGVGDNLIMRFLIA